MSAKFKSGRLHGQQLCKGSAAPKTPNKDAICLCAKCGEYIPGIGEPTDDAAITKSFCPVCAAAMEPIEKHRAEWEAVEAVRIGAIRAELQKLRRVFDD